MHAAYLVPEIALARVVTAGGPYRPGDDLSLAFTTPTVSRLVAHDAELRAKCVPLERALVPETIAVVITHAAEPYASGEVLTLSFIDPRVARIHESIEGQRRSVVPESKESIDQAGPSSSVGAAQTVGAGRDVAQATYRDRNANTGSDTITPIAITATGSGDGAPGGDGSPSAGASSPAASARSHEPSIARQPEAPASATATPVDSTAAVPTRERFGVQSSERPLTSSDLGISYSMDGAVPDQIRAGERMTLRENGLVAHDAPRHSDVPGAANGDSFDDGSATMNEASIALADPQPEPSTGAHAAENGRVTVRLEWTTERLRRFVQVVDKLFTIDRLGWYRHSLAMRLLIPDQIACGDMLASVEAMRHLQALRSAAVESLGKPLLAACMPGFSISSDWLETIESSREARAIAGLREALAPYADDDEETSDTPSDEAYYTSGTILRRELMAENASSVEAFLPLLIPTKAYDAVLGVRLAEYRRLLIELFAQTARAGEPVRLHQMAQPNHSLDDRLWQLVGAAAEAFGGFAHA